MYNKTTDLTHNNGYLPSSFLYLGTMLGEKGCVTHILKRSFSYVSEKNTSRHNQKYALSSSFLCLNPYTLTKMLDHHQYVITRALFWDVTHSFFS